VIATEVSGNEAMAYQTSASEKGEELIEPPDLLANTNPAAVTLLTVRSTPVAVFSLDAKTATTSFDCVVVKVAGPELVPAVQGTDWVAAPKQPTAKPSTANTAEPPIAKVTCSAANFSEIASFWFDIAFA
jgi:hypothetical protein